MISRQRLMSWWWDYLVVLAWLVVVFVLVGVPTLVGVLDLDGVWSRPALADLASAVLTVLPYLVYLAVTEAGPSHATLGKRRSGLSVAAADGSSPALGQVIVRNIAKVLPWQFGHMAVFRLAIDGQVSTTALVYDVLSLLLLVAVTGPPLVRRRGLHDVVAGTTVMIRASVGRPR